MNQKHILLVEDNPNDIILTKRAFKKNNINTELSIVSDGVEALNYLINAATSNEKHLPEVILLDLKLPRMDGLELLQRIRNDQLLENLPVVILTSSKEEQDIMKSYNLGANSYVRKPVNFEQFNEAIHQLAMYWLFLNEPPPIK